MFAKLIDPQHIERNFLLFASLGLASISLLYGIAPEWVYPQISTITEITPDIGNIFRATMGLYIGIATCWAIAAFKRHLKRPAVYSVLIIMSAFVCGRGSSFVLDGTPSPIFMFYLFLEISLVPMSLFVLARSRQTQ